MNKQPSGDRTLQAIAIFKLVKAVVLVAAGIGALTIARHDAGPQLSERLGEWIGKAGFEPGHGLLERALARLGSSDSGTYIKAGIGSLVYAALFLTEGMGLWLQKPWAEWFTVIITGSLIPLEVYEIVRHPTVTRVGVMVLNVAIVVYLLLRIRKRRGAGRG